MKPWFMLALCAALFWGAYVPTIGFGQAAFGATNPNKSMRAFLFIGLAYFFMAVVVPGIWLATHQVPEDGGFTMRGGVLSTLAGALGALGALGVVFSIRSGGSPLYVAPVVFAGAPIVNVLILYLIDFITGKATAPHPFFFAGMILAITGMVLVLLYSPAVHGPPPKPAGAPASATGPASATQPTSTNPH